MKSIKRGLTMLKPRQDLLLSVFRILHESANGSSGKLDIQSREKSVRARLQEFC